MALYIPHSIFHLARLLYVRPETSEPYCFVTSPITSLYSVTLFPVALQPNLGLGGLTVEVSRSHTIGHTQPTGLLWMSDQPVAEAATYTINNKHKRRISMLSAGFEVAVPAIKAAVEPCCRLHGHRYWSLLLYFGEFDVKTCGLRTAIHDTLCFLGGSGAKPMAIKSTLRSSP